VVLGHAFCGGIKAYASDEAPLTASDFIGRWMSQIAPAAHAITAPKDDREGYLRQLEFASVELSLRNLRTFPFVKAAVEEGALKLHGAYFGVASGKLLVRNEGTGQFEAV
jgi:carbonic anhydrase